MNNHGTQTVNNDTVVQMMFNNDSDKYFSAEWLMTIDDDNGQWLIMLDGFNNKPVHGS